MAEVVTDEQGSEIIHPVLESEAEPLLGPTQSTRTRSGTLHALDWRQVLGGGLVLVGLVVLGVGWWRISGTTKTNAQLTYLFSGGLIGGALVVIGATVLVAYEHYVDRLALAALKRHVDTRLADLEAAVAGEFDILYSKLLEGGRTRPGPRD
jgi:hypothetical protein